MDVKKTKGVALLALILVGLTFGGIQTALAQGGTVDGDKTLSDTDIACDGSTTVTLTLIGETGIAGEPEDIMLVLDRSGSMSGTPLADLKVAAKKFVDIIDEGTDGQLDGVISHGTRIGVVSFAGSASVDKSLTTNANAVKAAIDALSDGGQTNHEEAFQKAQAQLAGSEPGNSKEMIMFTDGKRTAGGDPNDDAAAARAAGTVIFAIGLGSNVNVVNLNTWATDPDSEHVFIAANSGDLKDIFEAIGAAITVPAATNIEIVDTVDSHFTISGESVDKGNIAKLGNVLTWTIDELGTETVTLTYTATHDNTQPGGVETVNDEVTYSDDENHDVIFPNPEVNVHGCAAYLDLTPETDENIVGEDHTVTATVTDDFNDPVESITVDFSVIGGPSVVDGDPSAPTPDAGSDITDVNGESTFTYTNSEASPDAITAIALVQANVAIELTDDASKIWNAIQVEIDIKPGSDPNSFGSESKGKIPVALLGSTTFDVNNVDDSTVRFGDAPTPFGDAAIAHKSGHEENVNGDAFIDRVYHFPFPYTNLDPSDTMGCLGGEVNGLDFIGCDFVNIVS